MFLPLIFKAEGLRCLIVGGGEVASRKVEMLGEMGCAITVIAPRIDEGIRRAITGRTLHWLAREYENGDCRGFQLVIAATDRRPANRAVSDEAKTLGIPVNVVDDPELCTVVFPAVWREGPLTVAVSTEGVAPFMAAAARDRLAGPAAQLARWVETAGRFRSIVRGAVSDWNEKNRLYELFVNIVRPDQPPEPPSSTRLSDWLAWLEQNRRSKQSEP